MPQFLAAHESYYFKMKNETSEEREDRNNGKFKAEALLYSGIKLRLLDDAFACHYEYRLNLLCKPYLADVDEGRIDEKTKDIRRKLRLIVPRSKHRVISSGASGHYPRVKVAYFKLRGQM